MSKVLGKDTDAALFDVPGEYVKVEKAIKVVERKTFNPISATAGDSIEFTYTDSRPVERRWWQLPVPDEKVVRFRRTIPIQRSMAVDTAMIIEIKDEFGLEVGCGVLIGESKKC